MARRIYQRSRAAGKSTDICRVLDERLYIHPATLRALTAQIRDLPGRTSYYTSILRTAVPANRWFPARQRCARLRAVLAERVGLG